MTTIEGLVNYVIANRRGKAFDGWTPIQLAQSFCEAVDENLLLYSEENGCINGVVHCIRFGDTIHVVNMLTTKAGVMKQFVRRFRELYPRLHLSGERHGKLKSYDTQRLVKHITQR